MKYSLAVLLLSVVASASWAQSINDEVAAAREEISALYGRIDSAMEEQRFDYVIKLVSTDAVVIAPGGAEMPMSAALEQMKQILAAGGTTQQTTTISSLTLDGPNAIVRRISEGTVTVGGQTRTGSDTSEDTWARTPDGWLLIRSVILGAGETAPPTAQEAAEVAVMELDRYVHPLDDLTPLGEAVGDARVVALGEATHGTQEFLRAKRRIVEYLVEEKGFTVLAVEGSWPETLAVDRYIKTSRTGSGSALPGSAFWGLSTNEVRELIEWMRDYNAGASRKLTFTGVDMQLTNSAIDLSLGYIRRTVPDEVAPAESAYQDVLDLGPDFTVSDPRAKAGAEAARAIVERFDRMRDAMIAVSSDAEWRAARHAAEIVYQGTANRMEGRSPGYRDEMMARNTMWLLNEANPNEKIILWAHNGHITFDPRPVIKPMGGWLREELGEQLYSVGFAVAGGELRAVGSNGSLAVYEMPAAAEGSGDGVLALAGLPSFFLDLRGIPEGGVLKRWLDEPHSFYTVGARWSDEMLENNTAVFSMSRSFDGLIFFREGSAAVMAE